MGSRPIARMALTGEFTPPGSTSTARRYSSAERSSRGTLARVLGFPVLERVGEVEQPHLLVLGRRVQGGALVDPGVGRDRVEDGVALLLRAAVGHGGDGVGPARVGGARIAVRAAPDGGQSRAARGAQL